MATVLHKIMEPVLRRQYFCRNRPHSMVGAVIMATQ